MAEAEISVGGEGAPSELVIVTEERAKRQKLAETA